jgi:hypothetical protein
LAAILLTPDDVMAETGFMHLVPYTFVQVVERYLDDHSADHIPFNPEEVAR